MLRKIIAHYSINGVETHSKEMVVELDDPPSFYDSWLEWDKGAFYRAQYTAIRHKQSPEENIRIEWIKEEPK